MSGTESTDAYQKQVQEKFEARQKSFVNQFSILSAFVFGFVAFILAPMLALTYTNGPSR